MREWRRCVLSLRVDAASAGSYRSASREETDRQCIYPGRWSCRQNRSWPPVCRLSRSRSCGYRSSLSLSVDGRTDRLIHLGVPGAAAEVPAQRVLDLLFAGIRVAIEQRLYRHNESRCAVSALRPTPVTVSFLD